MKNNDGELPGVDLWHVHTDTWGSWNFEIRSTGDETEYRVKRKIGDPRKWQWRPLDAPELVARMTETVRQFLAHLDALDTRARQTDFAYRELAAAKRDNKVTHA